LRESYKLKVKIVLKFHIIKKKSLNVLPYQEYPSLSTPKSMKCLWILQW